MDIVTAAINGAVLIVATLQLLAMKPRKGNGKHRR